MTDTACLPNNALDFSVEINGACERETVVELRNHALSCLGTPLNMLCRCCYYSTNHIIKSFRLCCHVVWLEA
jgi:hypothetical protein